MSISKNSYFSWYNDEIARYRNIEWQITGYSISLSYLTAIFSIQAETAIFVSNKYLTMLFVGIVWLGLFLSEIHAHSRLNEFRAKRQALIKNNPKHLEVKGKLWKGTDIVDKAYLIGFLLFPAIIAFASMTTIYNSK